MLRIETKYKVDTYFLKYIEDEDCWKPNSYITLLDDSIIDLTIPEYKIKYRLQNQYIKIKSIRYEHGIKKITIT